MRRRILTVGQTDVYLHLGTIAYVVYALVMGFAPAMITALGSILLHECAHGIAAGLCGQPPNEMELTPLGAVLRLEDEERLQPFRRLLMLAAGPAMSLLLCCVAIWGTKAQVLHAAVGKQLFQANLAILLLNLLPALPLDGGRMLSMVLGCFLRAETVRLVMRLTGSILGGAAIFGSMWLAWRHGVWNLSLAAAGCFLLYTGAQATTSQAMAELQMLLDRKIRLEQRGSMPLRLIAVIGTATLRKAVRLLSPNRFTEIRVLQPGSMEILGVLTEQQLISAYLDEPQKTCQELCQRSGTAKF